MDGPHPKCCLCYTFLYIVATPKFCITRGDASVLHHSVPGMHWNAPPQRNAFQNAPNNFCERAIQIVSPSTLVKGSSCCQILLLYSRDVLTFVSPNKTVEDWPSKFSALVEQLQQHGFCTQMPDEKDLLNQQEFMKGTGNEGAPAQDLLGQRRWLCCGLQLERWWRHSHGGGGRCPGRFDALRCVRLGVIA